MMVVAVLFTMSLGAGDGSVSTNKCIQSAAAGYLHYCMSFSWHGRFVAAQQDIRENRFLV